jgi:hypothetical protein
MFSVWSAQSGYKEEFSCEDLVGFRDASLLGYEPVTGIALLFYFALFISFAVYFLLQLRGF